MSTFAFGSPSAALSALAARLQPVGTECVAFGACCGRVLAETILADRDSPACDVSAMDGFAVQSGECRGPVRVAGALRIGEAPAALPAGAALRIVTGAPIPSGADAVVRHEDTLIEAGGVSFKITVRPGDNIRKRGENGPAGAAILDGGEVVTPAVRALLAHVGRGTVRVRRPVGVSIVVTGDELQPLAADLTPWQLRDSNGPALESMFPQLAFSPLHDPSRAPDDPTALARAVDAGLESSDLLLLTGGVSMGERDFVPEVLASRGVEVLFHRLPQRPGKPILGGVGPRGQAVLALPGNPVSVLVTARRFAIATLRRLAGIDRPEQPAAVVLDEADGATLPMWWHRLVRVRRSGSAELVRGKGSGDLLGAARSDGFVEIPPGEGSAGPWPYFAWSVAS